MAGEEWRPEAAHGDEAVVETSTTDRLADVEAKLEAVAKLAEQADATAQDVARRIRDNPR